MSKLINLSFFSYAAYDLATTRASIYHRHPSQLTIPSYESQSMPSSRPHSRQSDYSNASTASTQPVCGGAGGGGSLGTSSASSVSSSSIDVVDGPTSVNPFNMPRPNHHHQQQQQPSSQQPPHTDMHYAQWQESIDDSKRLALTLDEIVHIRSVMTKAELEGMPVDNQIKEDVERRRVCFLCMRTRFNWITWGVQCKLCARTVCSKCHTKVSYVGLQAVFPD